MRCLAAACPRLRELRCCECHMGDDNDLGEAVAVLASLTALHLSKVTGFGETACAAVAALPALRVLSLDDTNRCARTCHLDLMHQVFMLLIARRLLGQMECIWRMVTVSRCRSFCAGLGT